MSLPDDVAAFGRDVVARLQEVLGDDGFVGAYFVGSIALGGFVPGESDLDIVAVATDAVPGPRKPAVAEALYAMTPSCPSRGLELTLYRRDVAASSGAGAAFEVNVNGGPGMARAIHVDPGAEPGFWYVLDRAIANRAGVAISGPPPEGVFASMPRQALLDAMVESMRWHRGHEGPTLYSVLNAARAWRFAVEGELGSKLEGAAWARERWPDPAVIDGAVHLRHGRSAPALGAGAVDALLVHVERVLAERDRPERATDRR